MTRHLNRRSFLQGAGVALTLPWLDAMQPLRAAAAPASVPRRMILIQTNMGILPQYFTPTTAGRDFELTPYLKQLENHRQDFTVFSGVSHPDVDGGHAAENVFLTAAPHPGSPSFRNTISLDQLAAEELGTATRFSSLSLAATSENPTVSVTRAGISIPAERSAARLYQQLFVNAKPAAIEQRIRDLRQGRSLLDFVADSSRRLSQQVGARDRERLDQYFSSVRDLEQRMVRLEDWERKPKPVVNVPPPEEITEAQRFVDKARLMLDMVRLALETDSTRIVSFFLDATPIHAITHHGNRPDTLAELRSVEELQFRVLDSLLTGLRGIQEQGETLLDRTMVLYGTCMGNANSHSNSNLPILLAGGGFRHGQHLAFDTNPGKNYPLPNLFVSMLQRLGLEIDRFASSTGRMTGLEVKA